MRLILKSFNNINEARSNKERNIGKVFSYDEKFLNSLNKPGKTTFIRFSNEMPGGGLMLTPNFSAYVHGNSPVGIYGYPLELVKSKLKDQSLDFSHYKTVIVYWVDSESIINLNDIKNSDLVDLVNQIISYGGKQKYINSIEKWLKISQMSHVDVEKRLENAQRIARNILYNDGSVSRVTDEEAPLAFTGIIRYYGDKSVDKTLLLNKLHLKQKDQDGNIVEKRFSTILDQSNLFDPTKEGSGIQALTLSSKSVDDYEFFENPAAIPQRRRGQKIPGSGITSVQNPLLFDKYKSAYIDQLGIEIKNKLNSKVKFNQISGGLEITFTMAGSESLVKKFLNDPKKNKRNITEETLKQKISYKIEEILKTINGNADKARISWDVNFYTPGLETSENSPDTYGIKVSYPERIIDAHSTYSLIYFTYLVITNSKKDDKLSLPNPFISTGDYNNIITKAAS